MARPAPSPAEPGGRVDPRILGAVVAAIAVRLPLWMLWPEDGCVADECDYLATARGVAEGRGLLPVHTWVWSPAYPYLLALSERAVGDPFAIRWLQVAVAGATVWLLGRVATRVAGREAGLAAAWIYALHPTLAFFAARIWTETLYGSALVASVLALAWAREGAWPRAILPGALLGVAVLFRGIAVYLLPLFAVASAWPGRGVSPDRTYGWARAGVLMAAALTIVAPWSLHASGRFGGFVVSDTTLGRMMYLGNNTFAPRNFDLGTGRRMRDLDAEEQARGRPSCDRDLPPAAHRSCELRNGLEWIRSHPGQFVARVPLRAADLLNPNSFLTRHARLGRYPGMPEAVVSGLSIAVVLASFTVILGGLAGAWAWTRDPVTGLVVAVSALHVVAVLGLAGLTRYRVPWETLWIVFAAASLARPRHTLATVRRSATATSGCIATLIVVAALMLWHLPTGFRG